MLIEKQNIDKTQRVYIKDWLERKVGLFVHLIIARSVHAHGLGGKVIIPKEYFYMFFTF